MATVTDKRKVLSVEGNAKLIRHIGNWGWRRGGETDVYREFGLVNYTTQKFGKTEP